MRPVDTKSLAKPPHKFAVATISEEKQPVEVLVVVEGDEWDAAAGEAFSIAREEVHKNDVVITGVFEISNELGYAKLIATAGYARFSAGREMSDFSLLEPLVFA